MAPLPSFVAHAAALKCGPLTLVPALKCGPLTPMVVKMAWIDDDRSQGKVWIADAELDVSQATAHAELLAGPKPSLEPSQVVDSILQAFQRGSNEDIEALFQFVDPDGALASRYISSAGAMCAFRWSVRKEPRWRNIARRPQAALMHMRSYEVLGGVMIDPDLRSYMVRAQPFFPDAPDAESDVMFKFELRRIRPPLHQSPELYPLSGCWLVDDISPDFGAWEVRDPIGAGRAPDFFQMPKRSAEH